MGAWGYFLYQGVLDPLGGINSLWPLFGIANQILASVALVVATTILIKMGRARYVWVTLVPMAWLVTVTLTGAYQKLFHDDPRIGFLSQARSLEQRIADGRVPEAKVAETRRVIFNNRLDAGVTGFFALLILLLLAEAATEWYRILSGRREARTTRDALRAGRAGRRARRERADRASASHALAAPPRVERRRGLRDLPGPPAPGSAAQPGGLLPGLAAPPLPRPLPLLLRSASAASKRDARS